MTDNVTNNPPTLTPVGSPKFNLDRLLRSRRHWLGPDVPNKDEEPKRVTAAASPKIERISRIIGAVDLD